MTREKLKEVLRLHLLYRQGNPEGQRADLREADLEGAYLEGAYLEGADLRGADLEGADLEGADLREADLEGAYLRGAYLEGADLRGAYLEGADLRGAYLREAYLREADLREADLEGAYLEDCKLPHFKLCPQEGSFYAYKKTTNGVIKIQIPAKSKRTNSLIGRKCRAEYIKVISGKGCGGTGPNYKSLTYTKGEVVRADRYDSDIRLECTNGIHFFMTKEEAEQW